MVRFLVVMTIVSCLWISQQVLAQQNPDRGDFVLFYGETQNPDFITIAQIFEEIQVLEPILAELNTLLILPHDVPVVLAECGQANAFYDPQEAAVALCYELIAEFEEIFMANAHTDEDFQLANESIIGATLFILFHELGHALVDLYELPITGREEDAVDQLATLMLMESGDPDIEASALDGADFFSSGADQQALNEEAFWGEHSLDAQRFYNILCWTFGSDPDGWIDLVNSGALPEDRAERCPEEYARLAGAWETLLEPYMQ